MIDPLEGMFTTPEMTAIFSAEAHVARMLQFEAALARAEAQAGVIPPEAADAIAAACHVEQFNVAALFREATTAGTPVIPLVRMLSEKIEGDPRKFVHWGATSQDAIDTALVLQMRDGLDLLIDGLLHVCAGCATLAEQHRRTPMAGRTLLQQALPIPFGLKAARWLALTVRQVEALRRCRDHALALQFGGAAGTLAALGDNGMRVAELLAAALKLPLPDLPWHAERDQIATIAAALGVAAGAMSKIAHDIVLLMQTEVGEVSEAAAPGKGGSSAMPQKRNPVDAMEAQAAARLAVGAVAVILNAMANEHERAVGGWQAEWIAIPNLFRSVAGAVARVGSAVNGLEIDTERMRANLDQSGGLLMAESVTMALAQLVGRPAAQHIVKAAAARVASDKVTFQQALRNDPAVRGVLSEDAIDHALDPAAYFGSSDMLIDRALAAYQARQQEHR
jgi:3-carboxy-cis,cis-muconate cycloisomerase